MNTLTIRSHDDLISYVPHLMRFHPEGMVCVPLSGDGPLARLDLPPSPKEMEPFLQTLSDTYLRRHPTQRIALLEKLLDAIAAERSAWVGTGAEIAAHHKNSPNAGRFSVESAVPQPIGSRRFGQTHG